MKCEYYILTDPPCVVALKPGEQTWYARYPTFRKARMALIEHYQAVARVYRNQMNEALKRVVKVAHMEEPS